MSLKLPEDSIVDLCALLAEISGGSVQRNPGYDAYQSGLSFFYDRFWVSQASDETMGSIQQDIKAGGPRLVSFTEESIGGKLAEELAGVGFIHMTTQKGMFADLKHLRPDMSQSSMISQIGEKDLAEWSLTCETAFGKPSELSAFRAMVADGRCRFYAFRVDGKIVGTAMSLTHEGNCGVHEVGTLKEYRGQGICSALINQIISDAKADGAEVISLQASAAGEPVYARAGLKPVSNIQNWLLMPH